MRQLRHYQLRFRTLLFILAIPATAWWLAAQILRRADFRELAAIHEKEALAQRQDAESPIEDHITIYALGLDRVCRRIERALSDYEIIKARRLREQAARRATYHEILRRKYEWAALVPCLPLAPDPSEPE